MGVVSSADDKNRDDFTSDTKDLLAKRSGYICAYPSCKRMTIAGSDDRKSGLTITGVAAHITAASKNGPRYDSDMSADERSSESNGIWTCQIHGKFIDDNPSCCTTEELRRWKLQHENWVFKRVESGLELFNLGISRVSFARIGVFLDEYVVPIGRHNVLVGLNDTGKTSFCQIISAFSGGIHWDTFCWRFDFLKKAVDDSFIEACQQQNQLKTRVRISPQYMFVGKKKQTIGYQRIHVEVNGCPSVDWSRALFKTIHFDTQLMRNHYKDPKDGFVKALRYLSNVFYIDEDVIWDSLREELFLTSTFGYRFKRTGRRTVDVLVPDDRNYYRSHKALSFSEQQFAFLDIAIKMTACSPKNENWMYIFDSAFFLRMDTKNKELIFKKMTELEDIKIQTIFCLNSDKDAEILININSDKWVNALHFGKLTFHSFI